MTERNRLAASAAAVGAATALSRVAGLIRDVLAAALLGAGPAMSAFQIAFNVPNLIRSIVADNAISAAFVPVFVELREQGREDEAWRAAGTVLWLAAVGLGLLSAAAVLAAPWLVPLFVPGRDVPTELTVNLAQWMFPIIALLGLTGVVIGILHSYGRFAAAAFAPVAWNAVLIATLLVAGLAAGQAADRVEIYAVGMLVATAIQLGALVPSLRRVQRTANARLGFALTVRDPNVLRMLRLMVPVSIGLGLININLTIDLAVASLASGDGPARLNFAFRLFMLPQGLFSVAIATVLFPEMSRLAALGDLDAFRRRVADGLRWVVFLLVPSAGLMAVLALPTTRLVYERGNFGPADSQAVATVLTAFVVGLAFNGVCLLLTRALFSLQMTLAPTCIAAINLILNTALDLLLYRRWGVVGIAAATSAVTIVNAAGLAAVLHRRVGRLHGRELAGHAVRVCIATACCAAGAEFGTGLAKVSTGSEMPSPIVTLGIAITAAVVVYLLVGRVLGTRESVVACRGIFAVFRMRRRARKSYD